VSDCFSAVTADGWILAEKSSRAFEYVRYFGIVRTMPTYRVVNLRVLDLESYVRIFVSVTCC